MSKIAVLVASSLLIVLVGCSNDPEPPAATNPPAGSTAAGPTAEPETPSATPSAAVDAEACVQGRFKLVRFVDTGTADPYGTGTGGDVEVRFDEGKYLLSGAGEDPITLTIADQSGALLVDGRVTGRYTIRSGEATFTVGDASGTSALKADGNTRRLTMDQIADALAPSGTARLECSESAATIVMKTLRLEFERI